MALWSFNLISGSAAELETSPLGATILVRASSPGAPDRTLTVAVAAQAPTATVAPNTLGYAPMHLRLGTQLKLTGNGFCPGTTLQVGNARATAGTTLAPDGRSLLFRIPRLATTGRVTVVSPGAVNYATGNAVTVRTFRNYDGFQFGNFEWGSLSWPEVVDAFGDDDLFLHVNPCWPVYDCTVLTPIPDPLAFATFWVMKGLATHSGGHCFGMVRAEQELLAARVPYDRFTQGADHPFAVATSTSPGSDLRHFLDGRHATQFSKEGATAYLNRAKNVATQVKRIRSELQFGRSPGVALFHGGYVDHKFKLFGGEGHVVTAYDLEETAGGYDIYVYDNNTPFAAASEIGPGNEGTHQIRETGDKGVIHVRGGQWSLERRTGETWSGTGGTIWAIPLSTIPEDPTLILPTDLPLLFVVGQFGSADGAATVDSVPARAQWLPVLDENAQPMAVGTLLAKDSVSLSHAVKGIKDGTYTELLTGKGFSGEVTDVRTGKGVTDRIAAKPGARTLQFSGTRSRPLTLTVTASLPGGATHIGIVRTSTVAGGSERTAARA